MQLLGACTKKENCAIAVYELAPQQKKETPYASMAYIDSSLFERVNSCVSDF
jgi:hypothetical protein